MGLAIVRKIMEDHGGRLSIDDRRSADGRIIGAVATLELPLADPGAVPGAAASDNRHSHATAGRSQQLFWFYKALTRCHRTF